MLKDCSGQIAEAAPAVCPLQSLRAARWRLIRQSLNIYSHCMAIVTGKKVKNQDQNYQRYHSTCNMVFRSFTSNFIVNIVGFKILSTKRWTSFILVWKSNDFCLQYIHYSYSTLSKRPNKKKTELLMENSWILLLSILSSMSHVFFLPRQKSWMVSLFCDWLTLFFSVSKWRLQ